MRDLHGLVWGVVGVDLVLLVWLLLRELWVHLVGGLVGVRC